MNVHVCVCVFMYVSGGMFYIWSVFESEKLYKKNKERIFLFNKF